MPTLAKSMGLYGVKFAPYVVPINIREKAGLDLSDFQVRILLTENNFNGWDKVEPDGTDIYITDENGSPLPFYIELFNVSARRGAIWTKIPSIPANGIVRILLNFGNPDLVPTYMRDPTKVFDKVENFESGTFGVFTNVFAKDYFSITTDVVFEGTYALKVDDPSTSYGAGRYSPNRTFWDTDKKIIEIWMRVETAQYWAVYMARDNIRRFNIGFSRGNFVCYDGTEHTIGSYEANKWYKFVIFLDMPNLRTGYQIYDDLYNLLYEDYNLSMDNTSMAYTDVLIYSGVSSTGVGYADLVFSRKYALPEPEVIVEGMIYRRDLDLM